MRILNSLVLASGLVVASCGQAADHTPTEADHAAMNHGEMDHSAAETTAPAPLEDDGIAPVIDMRMAWMRPHPQGRDVTAAYFTVYLAEGTADRLTGAQIDGAERVELHGHTIGENGMMQMRAIGPQDLTPAGPMVFTPGGRHLMVHGLAPVSEGDVVSGTLVFERAGEIAVDFDVRSAPPGLPTEY